MSILGVDEVCCQFSGHGLGATVNMIVTHSLTHSWILVMILVLLVTTFTVYESFVVSPFVYGDACPKSVTAA